MYVIREKETSSIHVMDFIRTGGVVKETNTLRYGLYLDKDIRSKCGHIEVSVTAEKDDKHFEKRLGNFLVEAVKLYDKIVLGNTEKSLNEWNFEDN